MELIIKKKTEDTVLKNVFVIVVTMMHGDADGYTTGEVIIPKEKETLAKDAIAMLEEMLALPWNGAREAYRKMPNFLAWFSGEFLEGYSDYWDSKYTYELWEEMNDYSFDWDRDFSCEDVLTRCDGYEVFFYDENGVKHEVEVKK